MRERQGERDSRRETVRERESKRERLRGREREREYKKERERERERDREKERKLIVCCTHPMCLLSACVTASHPPLAPIQLTLLGVKQRK